MARVNKKLVLVVSLAAVVTVGVVGVVLYQNYKNDPTRHVLNGDAAMAAGEFKKAADYYGRAIGKRPNALEFHDKYLSAAVRVVPQTATEARERYGQYVASVIKRAQIARDNEKFWREVFDELRKQAELTETPSLWQGIRDRLDTDMVGVLAPDDKLLPLARLYMAFAQTRRLGSLSPEEITAAVAELEAVLPLINGDDVDLAYGGLLQVRFTQATTLELAKQTRQAADAWKVFDDLLAKAKIAAPNGLQIGRGEVARLRMRRETGDAQVTEATLVAACDQIVADALASGDGLRVYDASKVIGSSGLPDAPKRAAQLLEGYLEKNPDAVLHRRTLSYYLQFVDVGKAEQQARLVLEAKPLPVSLVSATLEELRISAAQQMFDLEFSRFASATDDEGRKASIERMEKGREQLVMFTKGLADDSVLVRADGKLLYAKGDYPDASVKFNEIFRRGTLVDGELYLLASATAQRLNMLGLALQHATSGLELMPANLDLLERKAMLEFQLGRVADAEKTIRAVLDREPTRASAKELLARTTKEAGGTGVPDANDPIVKALQKAQDPYSRNDFAGALAVLNPVLAAHPDDVRLLRIVAQVEAAAGNDVDALKHVEHGLLIAPNDPDLLRILPFVTSKDPAQRVVALMERLYPDGNDRTAWTYVRMANLIELTEEGMAKVKDTNVAEYERQKALLPGLRKAEEEWKQKAMAADPNHPAIHDYRFAKALEKKDFAAAQQIINEADAAKRDPGLPFMMRARLAVSQLKYGDAVAALQQAIEHNIDSSDVYRLMGYAQEQAGELALAVKSYGEGYKRDPLNMNNARAYVSALVKSGDRQQALVILRDARRVAGNDFEIQETWIALEYEIGDRGVARTIREQRYSLDPSDRRNSLGLATMLAELQPRREDIGDQNGNLKFNEPQWRALDDAARQRELDVVREVWRKKSDAIFADLIAADPRNAEIVLVRASTYRRQAKFAQGEAVLKKMIADAGDKAESGMWVALGVHYAEAGDKAKATAAFEDAVKRQDDSKREADAAIGEYMFQGSQWAEAAAHMERVAEKIKSRSLSLRLVEANSRLHQFDKAKARLAEAAADGQRDVIIEQLEANLAEAQGDDLHARKDDAGALKSYAAAAAALERAVKLAPISPVIAVQEASVFKKEFDISKDGAKLALALASADRSTKLRADFWPGAQAKSELLLAVPDVKAAITELERFVKAAPSVSEGRRRLIEVLVATDNLGRANDIVRDAISLAPGDPQWRVAQGELELQAGRLDQAILAFEQADRTKPDPAYLNRLTDLRLRKTPPDWDAAVKQMRDRPDDVRVSPYLQSAMAAALFSTGEQKRGLDGMRESFRFAKRSVADNSAKPDIVDGWFSNLRLIFPPARSADAEKFVNEISDGKPDAHDLRWLAETWFVSGPDGASRAVELAEKASALDDKKDPRLTARLNDIIGNVRYATGDCKGALVAFERAKDAMPEEPSILNNYAYLCGECGDDFVKGLAAAEAAVRIAPGRADYLDTLGFVRARSGDKKKAEDDLMASLKVAPSASANFHLAQLMFDSGRKDEARSFLRSAGDLKPDPTLQKQINALIEKLR